MVSVQVKLHRMEILLSLLDRAQIVSHILSQIRQLLLAGWEYPIVLPHLQRLLMGSHMQMERGLQSEKDQTQSHIRR
jgi:hypothetical protein